MKSRLTFLVAVFLLFMWSGAYGSEIDSFKKKFEKLRPIPDQVSATLDQMEKEGVITEKNLTDYNKKLEKYAHDMKKTFDQGVKMMEKEGKSEGKENAGASKVFQKFEDMANEHQKKLKAIEKKAQLSDDMVKSGKIMMSPGVIKRMTTEEKEEFLKFLDEPVRKDYMTKYPDLFAALVNQFFDMIATPAEAIAAVGCIALCSAPPWVGCAICCLGALADAASAYNKFLSVWNWCGKIWSSGWRKACKAAAVTALIVVIA